jgi:hypothetical protein
MNGVWLFLQLLASFGVTFTIASSHVFRPVRDLLTGVRSADKQFYRFFRELFQCYFCTGFWSSLLVAIVAVLATPFDSLLTNVSYVWMFGFAGATFNYSFDVVLKSLEKYTDAE